MTETLANINPIEPLRLTKQSTRMKRNWVSWCLFRPHQVKSRWCPETYPTSNFVISVSNFVIPSWICFTGSGQIQTVPSPPHCSYPPCLWNTLFGWKNPLLFRELWHIHFHVISGVYGWVRNHVILVSRRKKSWVDDLDVTFFFVTYVFIVPVVLLNVVVTVLVDEFIKFMVQEKADE